MVQLLVGFEEGGIVGSWEGNIHVHDIVIGYLQEVPPNAWGRLTTPTYSECSGRYSQTWGWLRCWSFPESVREWQRV